MTWRVLVSMALLAWACDGGGEDAEDARSPWPRYVVEGTIGSSGDALGQLRTPMGVDVDPSGRVWVADTGNARVQIFETDGTTASLAGEGWRRPTDVAIGTDGRVWVADLGADEVRCLNLDGTACAIAPVSMAAPAGVGARERTGPLVAQLYGHRVVSATGSPRLSVGGEGGGSSELSHPTDVAVLEGGGFAVADAYNHRIQLYDERGRANGAWIGPLDAPFHVPSGIDATHDVVHVADSGRRRVVALDSTGQVLATWRLEDDREPRILSPVRIAADEERVWIADPANDRIVVLGVGR